MDEGTDATRTVRSDGVTVRKTVETDGNVRLEISSRRESVATVRITDPSLESRPNEEIEFHADHIADWTPEDSPVFERAFDPDERLTVRYRVPDADRETLEANPEVSVTAGRDIDTIVDRSRSDALREFVGGDRESLRADPDAENVDADAAVGTSDGPGADEPPIADEIAEEPAEADTTDATAGADTDGTESTADAVAAVPSGGVARVLLAELREGRVDDETADALRAELDRDGTRSLDVRLSHLQSEVSDLAAYSETIESFIDRHGTFESVVGDIRSELSALEGRIERIDSTVEELSETVDRVDDLDADLEEVRAVQSELETDLEAAREQRAAFESRFETVDEELSSAHDRLDELEQFEERLSGVFRDLQSGDPDA